MSSPYICSPHSYQLQAAGVLQIHLKEREGRITYWRGATQLVVKTDEVDGVPRRHLVPFELFQNMPDEIMKELPFDYYENKHLTAVSKGFKKIYGSIDWQEYFKNDPDKLKSTLETAVKKNDIVFIHTFIPLLPPDDGPFNQQLSRYLYKLLSENIDKLNAENQLLLLKMDDKFIPNKAFAIRLVVTTNLSNLKTLYNIKAVLEMDFPEKPSVIQYIVMYRIRDLKNNPKAQHYLLTLPNEYFEDKPAAFQRLLEYGSTYLAETNLQFLLDADKSKFKNKAKAIEEYNKKRKRVGISFQKQ
jgi:hypothetical protein